MWQLNYHTARFEIVVFPLKEGSLKVQMKQIPEIVGRTLGNQTKTITSSSRTVGLLLPGMLVLESTTDPSRLEFRKVTVFVNLKEHPMTTKLWKKLTIPLMVHGDAAEFQSRDSLMIWSWGSLLCSKSSLMAHQFIACCPKSCTCPETWPKLQEWITWSFRSLARGYHPTHDPWGQALKKDSPFYAKKGLPLTEQGFKGAIWSIQGDHEFFSNTLGLPHWRNAKPCWHCDCQLGTESFAKSFSNLDITKQDYNFVTNQEAKDHPRSAHPLFSIPGQLPRW